MTMPHDDTPLADTPDDRGGDDDRGASGLADLVKKMAYLGVGAAFATQETASRMVRDMKLPREAVGAILQFAERNRDEVVKAFVGTLRDYLKDLDIVHVARKTLNGMSVKVSAEVQFKIDPDKGEK